MARPTKNDINSGIQGWDGKIDDNDEAILNAPFPIHEHTGDETDIEAAFPAAAHDRCLVWVNHVGHGHWLVMWSDGTDWLIFKKWDQSFVTFAATASQTLGHDFVQFTGTPTSDYDLLPAADWQGSTVIVRNDKTSGTLNIDPSGSEEINGLGAGVAANPAIGETITLYSNGTKIFASILADAV